MEWMLMPLRRYADFQGRSRRKEYWMFLLAVIILYTVFMVPLMLGGFSTAMAGQQSTPGLLYFVGFCVMGILGLALLVPSIAVQVRRFHDQDRSGWMVLIGLIPYVGGIIVLVFMCLEGTRGPNRFGPDPKDPTHQDVFA